MHSSDRKSAQRIQFELAVMRLAYRDRPTLNIPRGQPRPLDSSAVRHATAVLGIYLGSALIVISLCVAFFHSVL